MTKKEPASAPTLLAGGNPQIAKADGDAPVQAYIAAMPGWKHDVGRRLDALIVRTVPGVSKAVRWNSPFYGIEGQGWFLSFHCFTKYVKVTFFRGTSLRPLPPGESKTEETRYLDIHEGDELDEAIVASWIKQASELPGWIPSTGPARSASRLVQYEGLARNVRVRPATCASDPRIADLTPGVADLLGAARLRGVLDLQVAPARDVIAHRLARRVGVAGVDRVDDCVQLAGQVAAQR